MQLRESAVESWDELRYFLAIARARTLSAAAQRLRVDVSTVHRRLGALERRLGTRLFDRLARGFELTAAGEELRASVSRIDAEITATERGVIGRDKQPAGKVRLTTADAWAGQPLGDILAAMRRRYPEIELEVSVTSRVLSLTRRETDLALRPGGPPKEPGVIGRRVCGVAVALYANPKYLAGRKPLRSYDDLEQHAIVTGDESLAHVRFIRFVLDHAKNAFIAFRGDSIVVQASAARAGFGIAALPCFIGDPDADLVRVLPPHPDMGVDVWLLMHEDLRSSARVRATADVLHEALIAQRDLFEGRTRPSRARKPRRRRTTRIQR
jgi:DNA-binding transcriptional LysR family regulator